jgi:Fic family protein
VQTSATSEVERLKAELDARRPLATRAIAALRTYYDIELTHTSTAIEGNTLTARETAEVIEHGITVGGKPLRDHLEVLDHHDALEWMRALADQQTPLGEATVTELHRRAVLRSNPEIAGFYSTMRRRIAGSAVVFPNPAKLPALMEELGAWLAAAAPSPATAFEAHLRLVSIHPFADGNGRTARLLMNLILIRAGFPPIAVRPEDRGAYLVSLERAQLRGDTAPHDMLLTERLRVTLVDYLEAVSEALPE